ncbi:MAG: ATP-binding protein [Elusimicrobia bacterium]|nr:ATP-binding protein [Elusimicrobiota bacterium]
MIIRTLGHKLKSIATKFPIVTLVGPRQSGKTTLAKLTFPRHSYVSLEDLDIREFAQTDPRGFLSNNPPPIILDEIQRVPALFSYLQTAVDSKDKEGQYILTGSQNFLLEGAISQTLAGRTAILTLLPLTLKESKKFGHQSKNLDDCMLKGFYPRVYAKKIDPLDWYSGYVQTYIEKDIRLIKEITNLTTFQRFIKLCAGRTGQLLNLSSLGNDCGISHNTARSWLSLLESTFIVFLLKPYYENFNKRLVKQPKLYFYDTGLACYLLEIRTKEQLSTHFLRGALFESFVISEIMKQQWNQGIGPSCYFWRDKIGHEIDCLTHINNRLYSIEIKSSKTISNDFFNGLKYWSRISKPLSSHLFLIFGGEQNQTRFDTRIISWEQIPEMFNSNIAKAKSNPTS